VSKGVVLTLQRVQVGFQVFIGVAGMNHSFAIDDPRLDRFKKAIEQTI
jgi:hypothetical protein